MLVSFAVYRRNENIENTEEAVSSIFSFLSVTPCSPSKTLIRGEFGHRRSTNSA